MVTESLTEPVASFDAEGLPMPSRPWPVALGYRCVAAVPPDEASTFSGGTLAVLNGLPRGIAGAWCVHRQAGRSSRHNSGKSHRNRQELGARGLGQPHG